MTICRPLAFRALAVLALLAALPQLAHAQFGGMPGMPGSPAPGGFSPAAPSGPPAGCRELLAIRDEVAKHANAIRRASERHEAPSVACKLFRNFLAADSKMMKAVDQHGAQCGVPPNVPEEMKKGHANAQQVAKRVCDAAAQGNRPPTPSLSDAFGGSPVLPDASKKDRGGAFDSLTGNVLAR